MYPEADEKLRSSFVAAHLVLEVFQQVVVSFITSHLKQNVAQKKVSEGSKGC
jgi:hypothetical protein